MFCGNCGNEVKEDAKFCGKCGTVISDNAKTESAKTNEKTSTVEDQIGKTQQLNYIAKENEQAADNTEDIVINRVEPTPFVEPMPSVEPVAVVGADIHPIVKEQQIASETHTVITRSDPNINSVANPIKPAESYQAVDKVVNIEAIASEKKVKIKKKSKTPLLLIICIPVLLLAAVGVIFMFQSNSGKSSGSSASSGLIMMRSDTKTVMSKGGNKVIFADSYIDTYMDCIHSDKYAVITSDDVLYYVEGTEKFKISDDVEYFVISARGDGIAYITDFDDYEDTGTLYLYNTSSKKSSVIAKNVYAGDSSTFFISADGKTVSYICDFDDNEERFTGYIRTDGKKAVELGKNKFAIAISDNAKYVYYMKYDGSYSSSAIYVNDGKNDLKLFNMEDMEDGIYFNRDMTQIIFSYAEKTYISKNGKEKQKLFNTYIEELVLPDTTKMVGSYYGICVDTSNLYDLFVLGSDNNLYYINSKLEAVKTASRVEYPRMAGNNYIYYTNYDNGNLIAIKDPKKEGSETFKIGSYIDEYAVLKNGSSLYYINSDSELIYLSKLDGNEKKVDDDVESIALAPDKSTVYYINDYSDKYGGALNYSKSGSKNKIKGLDEVLELMSDGTVLFYTQYSDGGSYYKDVYYRVSDSKFEIFAEEVYDTYGIGGYDYYGY